MFVRIIRVQCICYFACAGALEGDERDSDGDAAAPTDQHAASGPATSLNEALLQQYPVAKQWVDQAGTANQTDTVKQAGTDTQHRVQSLELSCAGLTDTVVAAWLAHMRGLEQLSLAGHGWFDSQAAAAAAASHLPAAAATTTDQQQCRGQGHLLDTVHGSGVDDSQMQTGSEETMAVKSALSALGSHRLLRSLQLSLSGVSPAVSPKPSVSVGGQSARQHTAAVSQQQGQAGSSVQAPLRGSIGTAAGRSTGHSTHSMARSPYGLSGTSFEYLSSTPPVGLLHLPWMRGEYGALQSCACVALETLDRAKVLATATLHCVVIHYLARPCTCVRRLTGASLLLQVTAVLKAHGGHGAVMLQVVRTRRTAWCVRHHTQDSRYCLLESTSPSHPNTYLTHLTL